MPSRESETPTKINRSFDVIIVGSGPSGTATALHLCRRDPEWAGRVLIIDRATHPREKLCGGGVTHFGEEALAELGLTVAPRFFSVREVRLDYREESYVFRGNPAFRIIRRDEFDHWLVGECRAQGVTIHEGEALVGLDFLSGPDGESAREKSDVKTEQAPGQGATFSATELKGPGAIVRSDRDTYFARVVVGADGSKSLTRRLAGFDSAGHVASASPSGRPKKSTAAGSRAKHSGNLARLMEVLTPEDAAAQGEFREGRAVFDFSRMTDGLQGYYWDFPSYVGGAAFMNRGLFDSRVRPERPRADLKAELNDALEKRDRRLADYELKGHPIHWFEARGPHARPGVLLVGDAAGVDPLFGEGISFAIAYGGPAAEAIHDAFARDDFRFADYSRRLMRRGIFRHLRLRVRLARVAYRLRSPGFVKFCWRLARLIVRFTPWRSRDYQPAKARAFPEAQAGG
ncbi:MAG: NAD(P)/FAD-dependent oxidoreductase [Leptospirales bacterium]|jgi:flavin-dependent dehydrogenase